MTNWQLQNAQQELMRRREMAGVVTPRAQTDAGWLHSLAQRPLLASPPEPSADVVDSCAPTSLGTAMPLCAGEASHFPDIGLAAMAQGRDSHYRVWLMARLLDTDGRGWLPLPYFCEMLTNNSETHLYELPRLRALLREGDGLFWNVVADRLWLINSVKLAKAFGLERFTRATAVMPLAVLTAKVSRFRAEIFASWLVSRKESAPISQAVIQSLTGVSPRTQRRYCELAGVQKHQNIALGAKYEASSAQESAWAHGNIFQFEDFKGKQGVQGRKYVAWHLPLSYTRNGRQAAPKPSKRRRMNKTLNGLTKKEELGNVNVSFPRRFFYDGKTASKAVCPHEEIYYYLGRCKSGAGIWSALTISAL